jgi:aldehyde dehydrogenase (NAD+)
MSPTLTEPDISNVDAAIVAGVSVPTQQHVAEDAQRQWAAQPVLTRLAVLQRTRHILAARVDALCAAIPPFLSRPAADTMVAEVLPLLAACKFLEQNAARILETRRLGRRGLPFWLSGIDAEIRRVALGRILVIAPGNYPLFLPGVQTLQALAAGNAVVWKPASGGRAVAEVFAATMTEAGLPNGLLHVTEETREAAQQAIDAGVDKVFFTGSSATAKVLVHKLAESLIPCVAELSGCDAVVVMPSANLARVVKALAFGMRLNGSATCMAPRRVLLVDASIARRAELIERLSSELDGVGAVRLPNRVQERLFALTEDAAESGAYVHGECAAMQRPVLVTDVRPEMAIAQADIFAPLLMLIDVQTEAELLAAMGACPYALTTAIFGAEREAIPLAAKITSGTVLVNDLIVPTADPRVPFGGRRQSGFGVTRGAEGLLEMTAVKVISVRRNSVARHYESPGPAHRDLFAAVIQASHAGSWSGRLRGVGQVIAAGWKLR